MGPIIGGEDLAHVRQARRIDAAARHRIARHTTAETLHAAGVGAGEPLAQKVDIGDDHVAADIFQAERADIGDQPQMARAQLDLRTDFAGERHAAGGGVVQALDAGAVEHDLGRPAADLDDAADFDQRLRLRCLGRAVDSVIRETTPC